MVIMGDLIMFYIQNSGMYLVNDKYGENSFTRDILKAKGYLTEKDARKYSVGNEKIIEVI